MHLEGASTNVLSCSDDHHVIVVAVHYGDTDVVCLVGCASPCHDVIDGTGCKVMATFQSFPSPYYSIMVRRQPCYRGSMAQR